MFLLRRNPLSPFIPPSGTGFMEILQKIFLIEKSIVMSEFAKQKKNKGGRPKKDFPRDQQLAVMCTREERKLIEEQARQMKANTSEYLRDLALRGFAMPKIKVLPAEILLFTATLNHLSANMNQVAKKRNRNEELDVFERAGLTVLANEIKKLSSDIKNYLQ